MLEGKRVNKHFGGLVAIKDLDFSVDKGEIVGLIGPNGAGKTTLFNVVSGVYRPTSGKIMFEGHDITKLKPHRICKLGIGRTFQIAQPFIRLTVLENVLVGALFGSSKASNWREARMRALRYLEFVGLEGKKDIPASALTLADRKMLEFARALATEPKIVLLDEVVAGLNPAETINAMKLIREIRDDLGITIFWVEHVMRAVMEVAERIIVIHHGEKIAEGVPKEIAKDEGVIEAYLGEKYIF